MLFDPLKSSELHDVLKTGQSDIPLKKNSARNPGPVFNNGLIKKQETDIIFHTVCTEILKPVLNWANVCSPNILRTLRRTMIRFLIELLARRTWFGQFDELYFVLSWLVMRCKLRPELAADAQETA